MTGQLLEPVAVATRLIHDLKPPGQQLVIRQPLLRDESAWFTRVVSEGLVNFFECPPDCPKAKKWGGARGPDHFVTPAGRPRHMFSKPVGDVAWLSREHVPHIAAYGLAVLGAGYDVTHSSFSLYRSFGRDLISKRRGQGYETDAEFYDSRDRIHLQIEAKASRDRQQNWLNGSPATDASRRCPHPRPRRSSTSWTWHPDTSGSSGPGSVDPQRHVFAVHTLEGDATLESLMKAFPAPPHA